MIKAAIFDMDGLLIDSEPLWQQTELEVFNSVGVPLTAEMMAETIGLRTDEEVSLWFKRYPWDTPSQAEVRAQIDREVLELIKTSGVAKPGVHHAISVCKQAGLTISIASSSTTAMIEAVASKLGIAGDLHSIHSAEFETHGKPHPAVYIAAAKKLGVHPDECVAFEDSVNGVLSAKSAKLRCIAVPEPHLRTDKRYGIADVVLDSLADLTVAELGPVN